MILRFVCGEYKHRDSIYCLYVFGSKTLFIILRQQASIPRDGKKRFWESGVIAELLRGLNYTPLQTASEANTRYGHRFNGEFCSFFSNRRSKTIFDINSFCFFPVLKGLYDASSHNAQPGVPFPEKFKRCIFSNLDPLDNLRYTCESELDELVAIINNEEKFTDIEKVKKYFNNTIKIFWPLFKGPVLYPTIPERMPGFLKWYIKEASVVGAEELNEKNLNCFADKLVAMYKDDSSIENIAAAISALLEKIDKKSVSTTLPIFS